MSSPLRLSIDQAQRNNAGRVDSASDDAAWVMVRALEDAGFVIAGGREAMADKLCDLLIVHTGLSL